MKYFEFGKENKELMVMLHGGGVSYKVFTDVGHGGLPGEQPEHFADEVRAAHANTLAKTAQ